MAKYFEVSEESMKTMNRLMFSLYKYFSETVSGLESKTREWDNRHEINRILSPHEYYVLAYGDKKIKLHQHRNGHYSLDCFNIVLTKIPPYNRRTRASEYRYNNFYGDFADLESAISAFLEVSKAILCNEIGVFF